VCYGPGLWVLDADGLGPLPNTWLDCVFSGCESGHPCLQTLFQLLFLCGWKYCVAEACCSLFCSIDQQHVLIWIYVF
jgi:hypothetical protein